MIAFKVAAISLLATLILVTIARVITTNDPVQAELDMQGSDWNTLTALGAGIGILSINTFVSVVIGVVAW